MRQNICIYRYRKRILRLIGNWVRHRSAANLTSFYLFVLHQLQLLRCGYWDLITIRRRRRRRTQLCQCVCVSVCMWFPVSTAPQLYDCYQDQFYPYILWVHAALIINLSQIFFSISCRQIMQISSVGLKSVMREIERENDAQGRFRSLIIVVVVFVNTLSSSKRSVERWNEMHAPVARAECLLQLLKFLITLITPREESRESASSACIVASF